MSLRVQAKLRVPPAPAPASRSSAARSADTRRSKRAVARLHAAGQPDGADRRGAAAAAVVPDQSAALPQLRTGAARPRGRSGHHLPAGISLHQRHHQAAARQFRRSAARERRPCSSSGRQGSRHRHRLERRHAVVEFQEWRPARARHRADGRRRDRQPARHPDDQALFRPGRRRARSGASTDPPAS